MFHPAVPDIRKPEYLTCCGSAHVRTLATIIGIVCLIFCIIDIPLVIFGFIFYLPVILICILIYIAVICADKYEKPGLYLPFLIFYGIALVLGVLEIIGLIVLMIIPSSTWEGLIPRNITFGIHSENANGTVTTDESQTGTSEGGEEGKFDKSILVAILSFILVCLILGQILTFLCWNVVRKARRYMIDEVVSGNTTRTTTTMPRYTHAEMKV